jgi:hypothetical protein
MKRNRWIELSQRFYLRLLHLYPHAYREQYEMEMFGFFTQQCREASQQHGRLGILSLWPRTLVDVGATTVREHLLDPQARVGLLEVRPDAPLPWKGVLLVLIPGLVFFVSQIAQLTTDNDWFFIAFYRAAYYLILPVLLVWLLTRRFPIWGLIPLGLLYRLLGSYSPRYLLSQIPVFRDIREADPFNPYSPLIDLHYVIPLSACAILLCALIWYTARHLQIPRAARRWTVFYGLLVVAQIGLQAYQFIGKQSLYQATDLPDRFMQYYIMQMLLSNLYQWLPLLLLLFLGALFARDYGGLSFLLLLGYLLPTIVFGRYGESHEALPFLLVSTALLIYRFVVALIAPVWLVRAASRPRRQRAAAIPVAIAIATQIALNLIAYVAMTNLTGYQPGLLDFSIRVWDQLILAAGLGLAVALYLPREPDAISPPILIPVTQ